MSIGEGEEEEEMRKDEKKGMFSIAFEQSLYFYSILFKFNS